MIVRIKFENGMSVVELARLAGVAPCSILAANGCSETSLYGREIFLPVSTPRFVGRLKHVYEQTFKGRIIKNEKPARAEHIIKPAETFESLARLYGMSVRELKEFNGTEVCFLGQKILIP